MIIFSKCFNCTYYIGGKSCLAFPSQNIPKVIFDNSKEHNEVLPNQVGQFRFEDFTKIKDNNKVEEIDKAYVEGIYADTPQNRKLGRVGMTYKEYNSKIKNKNNNEKEKFIFQASNSGGNAFLLNTTGMTSKEAIDQTIEMCKDLIKYNDYTNYSYTLESQEEDAKTGLPKIWVKVEASKTPKGIDISVFDFVKADYIRNDSLDRQAKEREKEYKKEQQKDKDLLNFYKELIDYKKNKDKNG